MQEWIKWTDRRFDYAPPVGEFPMIVERMRGTPARIADRVRFVPAEALTHRAREGWTPQEHVGHLLDLESLWAARVDDYRRGARELTAADMTNRKTHEAGHNVRSIHAIIAEFTVTRARLIAGLDRIADPGVASLHPRLKRPMRLIDFCFFIAEHDDHHLALVTRLLDSWTP